MTTPHPGRHKRRVLIGIVVGLILLAGVAFATDRWVRHRYRASYEAFARSSLVRAVVTPGDADGDAVIERYRDFVNAPMDLGGTTVSLLQLALLNGNARAVQQLLIAGADPRARIGAGVTALEFAIDSGHPEWLPLLLGEGDRVAGESRSSDEVLATDWCRALNLALKLGDASLVDRIRGRAGPLLKDCDEEARASHACRPAGGRLHARCASEGHDQCLRAAEAASNRILPRDTLAAA